MGRAQDTRSALPSSTSPPLPPTAHSASASPPRTAPDVMGWLTNLSTESCDPASDSCDQIARGTAFISSRDGGDENGLMSAGGRTEGNAREYLGSGERAQQVDDDFACYDNSGGASDFERSFFPTVPLSSTPNLASSSSISPPSPSHPSQLLLSPSTPQSAPPPPRPSRVLFTEAEDLIIASGVVRLGTQWSAIARELTEGGYPQRLPATIQSRFKLLVRKTEKGDDYRDYGHLQWTAKEDAKLLQLGKKPRGRPSSSGARPRQTIDWRAASEHFSGRSVDQLQRRFEILRKKGSKKRSLEKEKPNQAGFDPIDGRDLEAAPSYPTSLEATTQSSSMASDLLPCGTDPSSSPSLSSSSEPPPPSSSLASSWTAYDIQPSSSPSAVSAFTTTALSPAESSSALLSTPIHSAPSRTRLQADRPPTSSSPSPGTSVTALSSANLDPLAVFSSTAIASFAPSPSASNAACLTFAPVDPSFRHPKPPKQQSPAEHFKPYPFLWEDREVRPKLRRLAQLLRRDPDDDEPLEEAA